MRKTAEPLFASERTAARLLDMRPEAFRDLVDRGHLPAPVTIGTLRRYDVDELRRVIRGEAAADAMQW